MITRSAHSASCQWWSMPGPPHFTARKSIMEELVGGEISGTTLIVVVLVLLVGILLGLYLWGGSKPQGSALDK
jgi:hypothetical protein